MNPRSVEVSRSALSARCASAARGGSMLVHLVILSTAFAAANTGKHGGIEVPEFGEPITNLTVPIGRDATFECIVVNLGNFRVGWVKADTKAIQAIHEHVITHNPRVSVSHSDHSTWYLHIKNVQEEDRGQYMCQINTDPMKSQMGFLDVVIPPDFIPEETSGDTMVPEGGTARVSCKARGVPPPRVMWKREDGMEIVVRDQTGAKSKVLTYQGEVLKLTKISRSEMGTYLCIAGNGVPPTVSKRIHISVHFHPVIQVPNQLVGAPLGTDVTIECYVESSPKSINYWVKDPGELIIPSEHHVMSVRQKSMFEAEMTMTIKNIRREDLGSYICVAKNSLGDVESKIRLYEIPGNDRHAYQYPDVRATSDDEYGTNTYDDDDEDVDSMKSNRVPDRANKWYSNDGKATVTAATGAASTATTTTTIFLCLIKSLL
ncbi:lachesin isoform X1 [Spodoptera frugiperda]|uniref:Lachesin isoform X1 n=2 Tax=Spodoptera frugiperda TaxID=7108 RepID=A0A9R0EQ76_SPOFR|nr:lachesin isoform X1 [Spodoptera frugiperda]